MIEDRQRKMLSRAAPHERKNKLADWDRLARWELANEIDEIEI